APRRLRRRPPPGSLWAAARRSVLEWIHWVDSSSWISCAAYRSLTLTRHPFGPSAPEPPSCAGGLRIVSLAAHRRVGRRHARVPARLAVETVPGLLRGL